MHLLAELVVVVAGSGWCVASAARSDSLAGDADPPLHPSTPLNVAKRGVSRREAWVGPVAFFPVVALRVFGG